MSTPTALHSESPAPVRGPEIREVEWHDPLAVELRAAMDRDIGPRYAGRFDYLDAEQAVRFSAALAIDPADIAATFIVVDEDGAAVAHAALRKLGDEWELKRLVTLPEHRGRGHSRSLVMRVEAEAVARGGRRLILQTGDRQPEAIALYRRLGYHAIPTYEPYGVVDVSRCFARDLVAPGSSALRFRLARPDEWAAIGRLTRAAYVHDYTDLPDEYREELARPERLLPDYDVWVAERADGALVGTVAVLREGFGDAGALNPGETYFRLLAVSPTARREGIGRALTEFVVDLARARLSDRVVLNSGPQMLGAHALYLALGFARQPHREHVITVGDEKIELRTFALELERAVQP